MTSHELAKRLLKLPDMEVRMAAPAHDYWRNTNAMPVREAEEGFMTADARGENEYVIDESCDVDDAAARR